MQRRLGLIVAALLVCATQLQAAPSETHERLRSSFDGFFKIKEKLEEPDEHHASHALFGAYNRRTPICARRSCQLAASRSMVVVKGDRILQVMVSGLGKPNAEGHWSLVSIRRFDGIELDFQ